MDIRKIKTLIEMLEDSNLNEIEIKEGEESVKLVKAGSNLSQTLVAQPAVQLPEENSISKEESQKVDTEEPDLSPAHKNFGCVRAQMPSETLKSRSRPPRDEMFSQECF